TRRRLRRPSSTTSSSTSISSSSSRARDQETSASVNRFKVRNRLTPAVTSTRKSGTSSAVSSNDKDGYKIVCYYTNWSQYRPKHGKFLPEDIEPDLCTHIIFAFGWLKKGKLSSFESNDETKDGKVGLYERIMTLKKANPKLKILLAIGGWSFGTQKFKVMSGTRYARQTFIYSAIPFLRDQLREAFEAEAQEVKKPRLLLTAAVPVGPDNVRGGYDVPAVASYLDFINLMAYDFHGKWERETGHNAPLYAPSSDSEWRKQLSVDHAATMWVKLGAPKDKLVIGMPTYGRTFTLSNPANFKVNAPASGGGKAGDYTKEGGFLAYYEVCDMLKNGASYVWDDEMKVPYAVHGDQWVGFDDERSIRNKMSWIKDNGYAGAMVWTVDMDDFTGTICGGDVKYPLIGAMSKVANSISIEVTTKPAPIKISVSEVLKPRGPQVFCYMTSWSQKRPGAGKFTPENVDPLLCTHVIYAFATLKDHKLAPADEKDVDMYDRVVALREKNPNLKILLAIGGWAFGSTPFKELTSNVYRMNQFVYEAIELLRDYKFNGLDVDWEYPRGADDRAAYVNLLKELRLAFEGEAKSSGEPRLLLTAAVPASFEAIAAGYDVPEISKYLDFINVMTYDFHGQWERQVGHNSPLYPLESATICFVHLPSQNRRFCKAHCIGYFFNKEPRLSEILLYSNFDFSAREWVKQGAPKEKLMIGMPTYGRSFTLVDPAKFDIGAPASGGGTPGKYTGEAGFMSYYEVCDFLHIENTTLVWDNEQQVPFAYRKDQWVGFDDERSLKTKMAWLKEEGFGGIMIWSVDMDDFRGQCGTGKYPLINAMRQELEGYTVKLQYDGPYEGTGGGGAYTTKDPTSVSCEEEDGHISYHPDKADCTMYYMCEGERKHHMPCPSNLVFNPNENVCDWPENVEGCMHHTQAPPTAKRK
ncbi:putative chitinase 10, partial [Blattella germanica]